MNKVRESIPDRKKTEKNSLQTFVLPPPVREDILDLSLEQRLPVLLKGLPIKVTIVDSSKTVPKAEEILPSFFA